MRPPFLCIEKGQDWSDAVEIDAVDPGAAVEIFAGQLNCDDLGPDERKVVWLKERQPGDYVFEVSYSPASPRIWICRHLCRQCEESICACPTQQETRKEYDIF